MIVKESTWADWISKGT